MSSNTPSNNPPITQPFFAFQAITERLPESVQGYMLPVVAGSDTPVTVRYTGDLAHLQHALPTLQLIAGRYQLAAVTLGAPSGEAQVYQALDQHRQQAVALKLYHYDATPKASVIQHLQGLAHPNVVTLYDYGHWQGRFFEVMELCAGGAMSEQMPFTQAQLQGYLAGINQGLQYCHMQGIVHRDIKPNNLFFREITHENVLIGDFGISSYLDRSVRVTHSAAHLTLDYAAPELLDGHEVSEKTDYYALGISLIHLLLGHSPWVGKSQNDILVAHLRGRVPLPDACSADFLRLLRGLTLVSAEQRWGYAQVQAWLQGDSVPLAQPETQVFAAQRPYPGYPPAHTPAQLAQALAEFDALKQLCRGDIRRWVFDYFDATTAQYLEALAADCTAEKRSETDLLKRLFYVLDAEAPLQVGRQQAQNLQQLGDLLVASEQQAVLQKDLEALLWNGTLATWIEVKRVAGSRTGELLEKIKALSERLRFSKFRGIALFALLYRLDPQRPLHLTPKLSVQSPGELKTRLAQHPKTALPALRQLFYSRRLEEWIQAAKFPRWQAMLKFLADTRQLYLEQQDIGAWAVRWYFHPDLPFPFCGQAVKNPAQLARLIDKNQENTAEGRKLLKQGWIRAWLVASGKIAQPIELDHALLSPDSNWHTKLEAVLHLLDPSLPLPQPAATPRVLNLGRISPKQPKSVQLHIRNQGRGYLSGEISLARDRQGITLSQYVIEGEAQIQVTVDAMGLQPGGRYANSLQLHSNGGELNVPLHFSLKAAPAAPNFWNKIKQLLGLS